MILLKEQASKLYKHCQDYIENLILTKELCLPFFILIILKSNFQLLMQYPAIST